MPSKSCKDFREFETSLSFLVDYEAACLLQRDFLLENAVGSDSTRMAM